MARSNLKLQLLFCTVLTLIAHSTSGQVIETVGSRALGMAGAFVAVASDSTATWWNPAGLAAGPFVDVSVAQATTELPERLLARRDRVTWFALGTPPAGVSYYHLHATDVRGFDSTASATGGQATEGGEPHLRSWSGSQLGVTLLHTLASGIHAGATVKYLRGTLRASPQLGSGTPKMLLDRGEDLEGGSAENRFDLDLGLLAVSGPMRIGMVVRNLRESRFGDGAFTLERQVRLGVALDGTELGGSPFVVSLDADVRRYVSGTGQRRVVAVGAERWFLTRRLALRGGGRFNTVGAQEKSAAAGVSVAVRPGLYVDGHAVRGGAADDRGWGLAARFSY